MYFIGRLHLNGAESKLQYSGRASNLLSLYDSTRTTRERYVEKKTWDDDYRTALWTLVT